jgi:hypothetical protein
MATIGAGFSQEDFWKPNHVKNNPCPYNLNRFMSRQRFVCIQLELRSTNNDRPFLLIAFGKVGK